MKDIAIYGAGGFGKEIACLINYINQISPTWRIIGFFDDGKEKGSEIKYGPILGGLKDLNEWPVSINVVMAIGNPYTLKCLVNKIHNNKIEFPNIVSPNTYYNDLETVCMGRGNIIQRNCIISCDVEIGDFNIFNGSVVIGHDVKINSYNVLMPAARISGEVSIDEMNLFGAMSCVVQQLKIGSGIRLGAGSVLMTKPKNDSVYLGVPAKIFKY